MVKKPLLAPFGKGGNKNDFPIIRALMQLMGRTVGANQVMVGHQT
jgi:hypothetical protein